MQQAVFHVIHAFDGMAQDFVVTFISSSEAEASAELERVKAAGATAGMAEMTMEQLKVDLLRERLGQLHDVLLRLEGRTKA